MGVRIGGVDLPQPRQFSLGFVMQSARKMITTSEEGRSGTVEYVFKGRVNHRRRRGVAHWSIEVSEVLWVIDVEAWDLHGAHDYLGHHLPPTSRGS